MSNEFVIELQESSQMITFVGIIKFIAFHNKNEKRHDKMKQDTDTMEPENITQVKLIC